MIEFSKRKVPPTGGSSAPPQPVGRTNGAGGPPQGSPALVTALGSMENQPTKFERYRPILETEGYNSRRRATINRERAFCGLPSS
jgi:hypothetical protein